MLDYQRIVDDVRSSLYTATPEGVDFMRIAAADYLVVCDAVNERLRHCGNLLKQGLRTEAIQSAEIEPNLLDAVATLDFPERAQWAETVGRFGIIAAGPLLLDIAAELNEAYAVEQPLASLLVHHRLLALARSPLRMRINVLQRLSVMDPSNPLWRDDLVIFERERQKQIQQEVAVAAENGDTATLAMLDAELRQPWSEMPPSSLLNWTAETRQRIARQQANVALDQFVPALQHALANGDLATGRALREQWRSWAGVAAVTDAHPLAQRVAAVFAWLAEQDEFEASAAKHRAAESALAKAIKQGEDRETLEKLHRTAIRGGYKLSPRVQQQYESRIAELERSAKRRSQAILAGIVAGTCLVAVAIVVSGYLIVESRRVSAKIDALAKFIETGNFAEADEFIARLKEQEAGLAADARVANEIEQLKELKRAAAERLEAFEAALRAVTAGGLDQPDETALRRAESLAHSDHDRAQILDLRGKISFAKAERKARHETAFKEAVERLTTRIQALEAAPPRIGEADQAISALQAELKTLAAKTDGVADELQDRVTPLLARLDQLRAAIRRQHELLDLDQRIVDAVGDRDHYRAALSAYVVKFPADPRATGLHRAIAEAPLWAEVDAWNALVEHWTRDTQTPIGVERCGSLSRLIETFCTEHPQWWRNDVLQQRLLYLTAMAKRIDADPPLSDDISKLFNDRLVADVWLAETQDGRRYYCLNAPRLASTGVNVKYLTGFDLAEKARLFKPSDLKTWDKPAPQAILARSATPILAKLTSETWDTEFAKLFDTVLQENGDSAGVDPLLRLSLAQQVLDIAVKGSHALELVYASQLKTMRDPKVSATANWLDPDDAEANASRPQANRVLDALRRASGSAREAIAAQHKILNSSLGKAVLWIGTLRNRDGKGWECVTPAAPPVSGKLYVVLAKSNQITLQLIGHADAQGLKIDNTVAKDASAPLLDGRPVYSIAP